MAEVIAPPVDPQKPVTPGETMEFYRSENGEMHNISNMGNHHLVNALLKIWGKPEQLMTANSLKSEVLKRMLN